MSYRIKICVTSMLLVIQQRGWYWCFEKGGCNQQEFFGREGRGCLRTDPFTRNFDFVIGSFFTQTMSWDRKFTSSQVPGSFQSSDIKAVLVK